MASKTINVTVEAWDAAAAAKRPGESFSDLLLRTFRPTGLNELVGLLSDGEAARWRSDIEESRDRSIKETKERMRRLGWP